MARCTYCSNPFAAGQTDTVFKLPTRSLAAGYLNLCHVCYLSGKYDPILRAIGYKPPKIEDTSEESGVTTTALPAQEGFLFGCDPELFIIDPSGKPVSAADYIPGTKAEPYKVKCGAVQLDGMAAEFNIDPAKTFEEFNMNISVVLRELQKFIPEGFTLEARPSVRFAPEVFERAPDSSKELGCSPDFDAWTGGVNPPPNDPEDPYMRCAAGHIHIGWTEGADVSDAQHLMNCNDLVKQLDWHLGAWSLRLDDDPTRRKLYGKAGACRYKPYGVEYRVLSNFWVMTRERRLAVWNRTQRAINDMSNRFLPDAVGVSRNMQLIDAINSSKKSAELEQMFRYPIVTSDVSYSQF